MPLSGPPRATQNDRPPIRPLVRDAPDTVSPTKFHNSVHNAAAGYWTIGQGCMAPSTALSAFSHTFAQGLLEALVNLAAGEPAILLAAYDTGATGPLSSVSTGTGLLRPPST